MDSTAVWEVKSQRTLWWTKYLIKGKGTVEADSQILGLSIRMNCGAVH